LLVVLAVVLVLVVVGTLLWDRRRGRRAQAADGDSGWGTDASRHAGDTDSGDYGGGDGGGGGGGD
jgi:hypothetical protein